MVASRTGLLGFDHELLLQLEAEVERGFHRSIGGVFAHIGVAVIEIVDFLQRAKVFLRRPVAIEAPAHGVTLRLVNHFHLVDVAVASLAGNPPVDVGCVVEIDVIRRFVHPHPFDWLAVVTREAHIHRAMQGSQFRAFALHVLMAIPAGVRGRHVGMA